MATYKTCTIWQEKATFVNKDQSIIFFFTDNQEVPDTRDLMYSPYRKFSVQIFSVPHNLPCTLGLIEGINWGEKPDPYSFLVL